METHEKTYVHIYEVVPKCSGNLNRARELQVIQTFSVHFCEHFENSGKMYGKETFIIMCYEK